MTLAEVMGTGQTPVDRHFFDDLGADSLVMAHFCARVRKRADLPPVSMKDIYRYPTIRALATALAGSPPSLPVETPPPAPTPPSAPAPAVRGTSRYVLCGALQLLMFLGYTSLVAVATAWGYEWIAAGSGVFGRYLRSVLCGAAGLLLLCAFPILVKWVLIGRWKPRQFRVWSLPYVRFWVVKTLIRANPLVLFVGSPLYTLYLRALGARIGRGVAVFSRNVPVCTDLLALGDGTVVRKDSFLNCYRAQAGVVQTGAVVLGKNVVISEATVLDIETALGDGAQLGHASSLHSGQVVPDGEHWHGSPAQRTDVDYRVVKPARCGAVRRTVHSAVQLVTVLLLYVPLAVGGVSILLAEAPQLSAVLEPGPTALADGSFYVDALLVSLLFFAAVPLGLLFQATVPRLLSRTLTPGKVYPLYGFHYGVQRLIALTTNRKFLMRLFGDSSAIVHYLRGLGYDLSRIEQTGSNFGTEVKHETPYLSSVGSGTMVADGLSVMNADFSDTSFRVCRTSIGPRNFLGNRIAYPSRGKTGDNCLLATKVMVPVDGEVREGVGLLGSPSFEIPRSVQRDSTFDQLKNGEQLRRHLAAKNRHNAATMGLYLLVRWLYFFWATLLVAVAAELYDSVGALAIALGNVLVLVSGVVYFVLVERAVTVFHPLSPLFCSIYDPRFWRRERFWKVPSESYLLLFNGTPFKNLIWRLLGVRIGRRVFDDGCYLTERTLAAIGDGCTLNVGSVVQCHSQEDGTFKSDRSTLGAGCTLGVGAFVHYGVALGDGAVLAPDSFLMKGEAVPPDAHWGGNPARQTSGQDTGEGWR
ncbi:phosphopantetheine-binding protein [Streptomyces sp. P9-2B-2]|uniref:Pls/PosA family non-ribosomal peptide synthetase n=1 Tax=Streptomyces sp. P9-2B-2 TaxID=3057114 RepID=UPI0025B554E8|nr:Pls/PosA family non-ribosomal peptide synthetase [Streptomyces sp. P9-2B-2]WJY42720.1 phosphopantetheine-binding protein [Streptomyces sp. P9-2B-2]